MSRIEIAGFSFDSRHFMISVFWNNSTPSAFYCKPDRDRQVLYYCNGVSPLVAGHTLTVKRYFLV